MVISVIVPIYNTEKYLRKCLDSIVNQTFKDLEIILVDDGSNDKCGLISDEYAKIDTRIVVIHQNNKGLSEARNVGMSIAKGYYLTFYDSDDFLEKTAYETVFDSIHKYSPDIVFFRDQIVNEDGKLLKICGNKPTGNIFVGNKNDAKRVIIEDLQNGEGDKIFKKSIVDGLVFEKGRVHGEDFFFNLQCLIKVNTMVYIDTILGNYVQNEDSITHRKFSESTFDQIYFKDKVVSFVSKEFPEYVLLCKKRAFLARLRIMRPINMENLQNRYRDRIAELDKEMNNSYVEIKSQLNCKEKIEYCLYMYMKPLYHAFLWFFRLIKS